MARGLENWLRRRPSFHVLDGGAPEGGEVDHIVIGPTAIFIVETRGYLGAVELTESGLTVDGITPSDDPLCQMRRRAAYVRSRLRRGGVAIPWVQAVLCVPYAQMDRPQCAGDILVTRREHLNYLIRHWHGRPLSQTDSARAVALLQPHAHASAA